ncbi:MAG: hypothetical protein GC152_00645 [Alphaproteobacteria bacterium]|nr:hypothetical protein [Alphaproteobacteria bacterium]
MSIEQSMAGKADNLAGIAEGIVAAALAALVVAMLIADAFPEAWPAELLVSLSPQGTICGVTFAIIGVARRSAVIVLPAVAVAYLGWIGMSDRVASAPIGVGSSGDVSTLVWANVHREVAPFVRAIELALQQDADVVAFGEAPEIADVPVAALKKLRSAFPFEAAPEPSGGVLLLAKTPFENSGATRKNLKRSVRGATRTQHGRIDIVAVHLPTPMSPGGQVWRDHFMQETLAIARPDVPALMVGDFNATPWSPQMRRWIAGGRFLRVGGKDSPTWFSRIPGLGLPIDHAFVAGGVRASVEIGPDIGSDHYPLIVRFKAPGTNGAFTQPIAGLRP